MIGVRCPALLILPSTHDFHVPMKIIQAASLLLLLVGTATGCTDDKRLLYRKDGKWETVRQETRAYAGGIVSGRDNNIYLTEATFLKDGTATLIIDGTGKSVNWTLNEDGDKLDLCDPTECVNFTVTQLDKENQKWQYSAGPDSSRVEIDYDLVRR
jgi:hypothetical protein